MRWVGSIHQITNRVWKSWIPGSASGWRFRPCRARGHRRVWPPWMAFYIVLVAMMAPCVWPLAKNTIPDEMSGNQLQRCTQEGIVEESNCED
jgi:hypothetical protein